MRDHCLNAGSVDFLKKTSLKSNVAGAIIAAFGAAIVPEAGFAVNECQLPGTAQNGDFTVWCRASILTVNSKGNLYHAFSDSHPSIIAGKTITVILEEFTINPLGTASYDEGEDGPENKGEYYGAYFEGRHIRNLTVISSASVTTRDGIRPKVRFSRGPGVLVDSGEHIQSGGIHALISGTSPAKAAQPDLTLTIKTGEIVASNYIVFAKHNANGNTFINIEGGTITERQESDEVPLGEPVWSHRDVSGAVVGWNQTTGDITIAVSGGTISTAGERNHGVFGFKGRPNKRNSNSLGVLPSGKIKIDLTGGTITTAARGGHGIYAVHGGTGEY